MTSSWARSMVWLHQEPHRGLLGDDTNAVSLVRRAEELAAGMTPRGRKALGLRVAEGISGVIGRTRHAGVFSGEPVARAVMAFHAYLPHRTVERAVPWCLKIWGMRAIGTRGAHPGWLGLAEAMDHGALPRASSVLCSAACHLLWGIGRDVDGARPLTSEDALSLARCALFVARASRYRPYGFADGVTVLREIAQACSVEDEGSWTGVLDTLGAMPEWEAPARHAPWRPTGQEQEACA